MQPMKRLKSRDNLLIYYSLQNETNNFRIMFAFHSQLLIFSRNSALNILLLHIVLMCLEKLLISKISSFNDTPS
jgi:hypothetical protein